MKTRFPSKGQCLIANIIVYLCILFGIATIFVAHRLAALKVPAGMDAAAWSGGHLQTQPLPVGGRSLSLF
jgi:TRAP-type C4-dicarboxylate transport system permease small subunit